MSIQRWPSNNDPWAKVCRCGDGATLLVFSPLAQFAFLSVEPKTNETEDAYVPGRAQQEINKIENKEDQQCISPPIGREESVTEHLSEKRQKRRITDQ